MQTKKIDRDDYMYLLLTLYRKRSGEKANPGEIGLVNKSDANGYF